MSSKTIRIGTGIATALLIAAVSAPAGSAHALAQRPATGAQAPDWLTALAVRSDALNRRYGLGKYALRTAGASTEPDWVRGLAVRSDALNRKYRLGRYANAS